MPTLETITDISSDDIDLLEAAGWVTLQMLAKSEADDVLAEIEKANGVLKLVKKLPGRNDVANWILEAREISGEAPEVDDESEADSESETSRAEESFSPMVSGPVNFEADPEISEMLDLAPVALPIPNRMLAEQGISPSEIAIAPVLNHAESDLDVRVTAKERKQRPRASANSPEVRKTGVNRVADSAVVERREFDKSRVRVMECGDDGEDEHPHLEKRRQSRDERLTLLRTTRESTNRGRKPGTRRYIRGVLHDRPVKVWFGCLIVILFQLTVPLSIIAALLLIITEHSPTKLEWVPSWIIAFPLALPILGVLYFIVSVGAKCRVCGQKVLVHRQCRKNKKAHHVFGFGYVLPLALQTLFFLWFNCTFCGTSIRIKE